MQVRQAALTGQSAGDGDVQELSQSGQLLRCLREENAAAGMEHRVLGIDQLLGDGLGGRGIQAGTHGDRAILIGAGPQVLLHFAGKHIHGDINQNRAGTAGLRHTECLVQDIGQRLHIIDAPTALTHGLQHFVLIPVGVHIDLLVGMAAKVVAGHVTGNDDHGDGIQRCVGYAGNHICQAGTQVAHDHGGLVGYAGIAIGGGGGDGLMPGADVLNFLAPRQGIQHTDHGVAAQAEQLGHTAAFQIIHQQIRYKFLAHILKSSTRCMI